MIKHISDKPAALAGRIQDHLKALEVLHSELCSNLQVVLSETLERDVMVVVSSVQQRTLEEYVESLPTPSCTYQFLMSPLPSRVILDLGPALSCAVIDHATGLEGSDKGGPRPLTLASRKPGKHNQGATIPSSNFGGLLRSPYQRRN